MDGYIQLGNKKASGGNHWLFYGDSRANNVTNDITICERYVVVKHGFASIKKVIEDFKNGQKKGSAFYSRTY